MQASDSLLSIFEERRARPLPLLPSTSRCSDMPKHMSPAWCTAWHTRTSGRSAFSTSSQLYRTHVYWRSRPQHCLFVDSVALYHSKRDLFGGLLISWCSFFKVFTAAFWPKGGEDLYWLELLGRRGRWVGGFRMVLMWFHLLRYEANIMTIKDVLQIWVEKADVYSAVFLNGSLEFFGYSTLWKLDIDQCLFILIIN